MKLSMNLNFAIIDNLFLRVNYCLYYCLFKIIRIIELLEFYKFKN